MHYPGASLPQAPGGFSPDVWECAVEEAGGASNSGEWEDFTDPSTSHLVSEGADGVPGGAEIASTVFPQLSR